MLAYPDYPREEVGGSRWGYPEAGAAVLEGVEVGEAGAVGSVGSVNQVPVVEHLL